MISSFHTPAPRDDRSQCNAQKGEARRRLTLTLIFAVVLISVAGFASAQSPQAECMPCGEAPIAFDSVSPAPVFALPISNSASGAAVPWGRKPRPVSVSLTAELANLDEDADPDGWRAQIVLLDRDDIPVVGRANASFELMPRVAILGGDFVDGQLKPIRWSMPLKFDEGAVTEVKLPLRQSLRPVLGWSGLSKARFSERNRRDSDRQYLPSDPRRAFETRDVRDAIARPTHGVLRVRVSVPTEGTFEAVAGVRVRPSVLVDTQWPYR